MGWTGCAGDLSPLPQEWHPSDFACRVSYLNFNFTPYFPKIEDIWLTFYHWFWNFISTSCLMSWETANRGFPGTCLGENDRIYKHRVELIIFLLICERLSQVKASQLGSKSAIIFYNVVNILTAQACQVRRIYSRVISWSQHGNQNSIWELFLNLWDPAYKQNRVKTEIYYETPHVPTMLNRILIGQVWKLSVLCSQSPTSPHTETHVNHSPTF